MRPVRVALVVVVLALSACATTSPSARSPGAKIQVVASISAWGSLAAEVGGDLVDVTTIVSSPSADPHDYEPTAEDARDLSTAQLVILNGAGYDEWARAIVDANDDPRQRVIDVGQLVGARAGENPHRWYFPSDVEAVADRIAAELRGLDPRDGVALDRAAEVFAAIELRPYRQLISDIRTRYTGTPVGASESLFEGMATATGLDLRTPASFLQAISEGTDPSLDDKRAVERSIAERAIRVFVFNPQNSTPDVGELAARATRAGVPVVRFTETITPAGATFTEWQIAQLHALEDALAGGRGA